MGPSPSIAVGNDFFSSLFDRENAPPKDNNFCTVIGRFSVMPYDLLNLLPFAEWVCVFYGANNGLILLGASCGADSSFFVFPLVFSLCPSVAFFFGRCFCTAAFSPPLKEDLGFREF